MVFATLLNFYGTRSVHYFVEFSASNLGQWNKDEQDINLMSIPKIFYGTRIKPGSMSLKFYVTGTLVGELKDTKYNGELIQVGPYGPPALVLLQALRCMKKALFC